MSFSFLPLRILQSSAWRDCSKLKTIFVERPPSIASSSAMPFKRLDYRFREREDRPRYAH
jgi:hypothetical protein